MLPSSTELAQKPQVDEEVLASALAQERAGMDEIAAPALGESHCTTTPPCLARRARQGRAPAA